MPAPWRFPWIILTVALTLLIWLFLLDAHIPGETMRSKRYRGNISQETKLTFNAATDLYVGKAHCFWYNKTVVCNALSVSEDDFTRGSTARGGQGDAYLANLGVFKDDNRNCSSPYFLFPPDVSWDTPPFPSRAQETMVSALESHRGLQGVYWSEDWQTGAVPTDVCESVTSILRDVYGRRADVHVLVPNANDGNEVVRITDALVASCKIQIPPLTGDPEVSIEFASVSASTTNASIPQPSPVVCSSESATLNSPSKKPKIIRRVTQSPQTKEEVIAKIRESGANVVLMPPSGAGPSYIVGKISAKEEQLQKKNKGGKKRSRDSYCDGRYVHDSAKEMVDVATDIYGEEAFLSAVRAKFPAAFRDTPTKNFFNTTVLATLKAVKDRLAKYTMDRVYGIGISLAKQRLFRKVISSETINDAIDRGVKRPERKIPPGAEAVATSVVGAVHDACAKKKKIAPETETSVRALDRSGVWKDATESLIRANPGVANVNKLRATHIKRLYMRETAIPPDDPSARPVTCDLEITVSHVDGTHNSSFSGKFPCPSLPTFNEDQKVANSTLVGNKAPTPLSFEAASVLSLQKMQQVPIIIRNDTADLRSAVVNWRNQNPGMEVNSGSFKHIINITIHDQGDQPLTLAGRHPKFDKELLAELYCRIWDGNVGCTFRDTVLGDVPHDSAIISMVHDEMIYIGDSRSFVLPDGVVIDIRIRDARVVIMCHLQFLAYAGAFRKGLSASQLTKIRYIDWLDGSTVAKKRAMLATAGIVFDGDIFNPGYEAMIRHPLLTMLSFNASETRDVSDIFSTASTLNYSYLQDPMDIDFVDEGIKPVDMPGGYDGVIGDNHRVQVDRGGKMSGECTCVYCTAKVSQFWDILACMAAEPVTMTKIQQYWSNGTHSNIGAHLMETPAATLMGDVESPLSDRALNIENSSENMDANLHERVGLVKLVGFWMFANEFSQKEMDLVKKNMTMHMGKGHGPTEYMDGGTWVKLLVKYEYVVIPSIPINLQPTARIVQRVILDMTCITSVDIGNSEIPREKLCLALSSLALVLWLVLIDLKRHGVIKIENMSLYVHHWLSCIPRLFENKDFSDYVTQDFERMFHFSKTTERMTNHNANNIGVEIIKRDQCESNRKRRFRTRHGYSGDGELSAWRLENPLTNITLSPYLASVYSAEVVAYFNGRITNSSFGYERGTDYEHCTDGSIVFKVNGVSSAGNYNYTNESASLSEVVKIQPWMTCKRENDMGFYTRLSGQPGSDLLFYKVPQLKRFLYDAGVLKPTGSKPQLVERVRGYLNLPWGDQRRGSYLEWLSGSPTVVEGGLVGDDKSRYGLVPFTPPPQRKNRKRKHTEAVLFSLCELQRTLHRQGNHPYVPCRKALQTAFWVVPFDASTTTPWQCMPPPENPFEGSDAVRTVAEVYTQVTGGEHRFVSLTLDKPWAVFSTLKSVLQNAKAGGMVVEVDLTKVGHIYNLSTEEAGLFFSLDTEALCQCWSSSEIFVSAVPDSALTGQGWFISPASGPGREVIGVHGSDRILNADGSIRVFGRYGLWREAFSAFVETNSGPVALFNGLRCVRPDE